MTRRVAVALAAVAVLAGGCAELADVTDGVGSSPSVAIDRVPEGTPDAATARTTLTSLTVAPPGPLDGYERDCEQGSACVFGQPWYDVDGDGCDQRSQVLARDLADVTRKKDGRCAVASGTLDDPYTGEQVTAVSKIQIDHVVPLAEMWRSGAAGWPAERRVAAANDLANLIAVQGKANQSKSDKTPDQWMPPNAGYACPYARVYIGVKGKYGLTVSDPERAALESALARCRT
ncbi:HNH endonuclease family protein [Actinosynnema sp. NPDC020468]|uniref:HNH endonuclease family protein n=1 Tax=Actinosynnema sp. NPDC020468 TaxID=3154488 RepID=UPI0033E61EA0